MQRKWTVLLFLLLAMAFTGCSKKLEVSIDMTEREKTKNELFLPNNLKVELVSFREMATGKSYNFKLINDTSHVITQNVAYLSYPIKKGNSLEWNKFKIEADGNKLNIQPKEEVFLNVSVRKEIYEGNEYLDLKNPEIEIVGYHDKIVEDNRFQILGLPLTKKRYN